MEQHFFHLASKTTKSPSTSARNRWISTLPIGKNFTLSSALREESIKGSVPGKFRFLGREKILHSSELLHSKQHTCVLFLVPLSSHWLAVLCSLSLN